MPDGTRGAALSNGQKLEVGRRQSKTLRERFLKLQRHRVAEAPIALILAVAVLLIERRA
jgi:hypothetical protein